MVINIHHPFPHLPSKSLNVVLSLRREGKRCFGLVPIPKTLPAFFRLEENGLRYLLTEQVVDVYKRQEEAQTDGAVCKEMVSRKGGKLTESLPVLYGSLVEGNGAGLV